MSNFRNRDKSNSTNFRTIEILRFKSTFDSFERIGNITIQGTRGADSRTLVCIKCEGVTDLSYCVRTVNCTAGQECFAEHVIGDDASVFYNAGCKDSRMCRASGHESLQVRDKIQVCEKCCVENLCNKHLCKGIDAASENKTCYLCDGIDDPLKCEIKTTCLTDQQCFIQEYLNDRYEKNYRLGCETRKRCELLIEYGRSLRDMSQLCNECCHSKDCNRYLCKEDNITMLLSLSTGVPLSHSTSVPLSLSTGVPLSLSTREPLSHSTREPLSHSTSVPLSLSTGVPLSLSTGVPVSLSTSMPLSLSTSASLTLSTGVLNGSTITPETCVDSSTVNCTELEWSLHICSQKTEAALRYCSRFCGFCTDYK
ncbi:hypothetical protein CHS0354_015821 [Potamilus streckersoni]|uniref:ShKT domain-containing protein n=1 Tax=Potamilus streckersoni TaxID=2493646 RepID=A0AAE0VTU3_9BIVA|nr:hypothetical protein CHS0354_015821 [Potamilus streckersoni]